MKFISLFVFAILLHCSTLVLAQKSSAKPSVIFILADDLGYGDVGVYGQKLIQTPTIDLLAKEGVRFTDF